MKRKDRTRKWNGYTYISSRCVHSTLEFNIKVLDEKNHIRYIN